MNYGEFLQSRMVGIGGSDVAGILDMSPWSSPMSVFKSKLIPSDPDEEMPPYIQWGNILEPVIAKYYEDENDKGRKLEKCGELLKSDEHPWMIGNIDRWVECPEKGRGICEIKNVSAFARKDWQDGPPIHYMLQMQHYLHVTGCTWGVFVIFLGNDCLWIDVERDDELVSMIIDATRDFWQRVQDNDPPTADGHKATRKAILELYPQGEEDEAVALDDDAAQWDAEIAGANAQIKELEALKEDRSNKLRQAIGSATLGVLPGEQGAYSYKTNKSGNRVLRRKGA